MRGCSESGRTIAAPPVQANAFRNSVMFESGPYAPARRGVRIDGDEQPAEFVAVLLPPSLREAEEKPLLRGEPVNARRAWQAREGPLERRVRDAQSVQVGEVLTQRELAVHVQRVHSDEAGELVRDELRLRLEPLCVLLGPPVA